MQIYFIRHAQSENNRIYEISNGSEADRKADPLLTNLGILQAEITGNFLAQKHPDVELKWIDPQNRCGFGLSYIYCSLMERAVHTGTILSEKLGIPLEGVVDLHEVGGIYLKQVKDDKEEVVILHGHNRAYFEVKYPKLIVPTNLDNSGWWPGGIEPKSGRFDRAARVIDFFKERHPGTDEKIGVIMHGGIYRYIFRYLFNIMQHEEGDLDLPFQVIVNNCSISRIDIEKDNFILLYQNFAHHLPTELIT